MINLHYKEIDTLEEVYFYNLKKNSKSQKETLLLEHRELLQKVRSRKKRQLSIVFSFSQRVFDIERRDDIIRVGKLCVVFYLHNSNIIKGEENEENNNNSIIASDYIWVSFM